MINKSNPNWREIKWAGWDNYLKSQLYVCFFQH